MNDMPTPRTHLLPGPDGRIIAVDEVGPAGGDVVVLLHSSPGSRRFDPDPRVTREAGIRLLTIDRPGFGDSSPLRSETLPRLTDRADDVAEVLTRLGVAQAGVVGWSHGGRVAAALAARHPEVVRSLAVVGTPSPEDLSWIAPEQQALLEPLRSDPSTAAAGLAAVLDQVMGGEAPDPDVALSFLAGDGDTRLLADRAIRGRVDAMLGVAFAQGTAGIAGDVVSDQIVPWGFDPRSIGAPTLLAYSRDDFVATHHGDWWAAQIGGSITHTTEGVGHLLVVTEWPTILGHVTRTA